MPSAAFLMMQVGDAIESRGARTIVSAGTGAMGYRRLKHRKTGLRPASIFRS